MALVEVKYNTIQYKVIGTPNILHLAPPLLLTVKTTALDVNEICVHQQQHLRGVQQPGPAAPCRNRMASSRYRLGMYFDAFM